MRWSSVQEFLSSKTYAALGEMHAWTKEKLDKFVAAFNEVYDRAMRNGATDEKASGLALTIARDVARRTASAETASRAEKNVHYFAAHVPLMAGRSPDGTVATGSEFRFTLVDKALPMLKTLVAGVAFNWEHAQGAQIGIIRDIIPRSEAPAEVQAATDPDVPFLYVASYRDDIPAESRNEIRISPEWLVLDGSEVIPLTFAATHSPINGEETGIRRIEASMLFDPAEVAKTEETVVVSEESNQTTKGYQPKIEYATTGVPTMPESTTTESGASDVLAAQVASLSAKLQETEAARKETDLKYAALKEQADRDHALVEALQAAALESEANEAALKLAREGKIATDAVVKFAARYKKLGKEEFNSLAEDLPVKFVAQVASQAVAAPEESVSDAMAASIRAGAVAAMKGGF